MQRLWRCSNTLHLCCWLCSHHKARHCLCCQSACQNQLQPWTSSLASCQACTSLLEGYYTAQTCLSAFYLTRTLYHLFWCWSWWKSRQWQVHRHALAWPGDRPGFWAHFMKGLCQMPSLVQTTQSITSSMLPLIACSQSKEGRRRLMSVCWSFVVYISMHVSIACP